MQEIRNVCLDIFGGQMCNREKVKSTRPGQPQLDSPETPGFVRDPHSLRVAENG